jgi:hypothetical protein
MMGDRGMLIITDYHQRSPGDFSFSSYEMWLISQYAIWVTSKDSAPEEPAQEFAFSVSQGSRLCQRRKLPERLAETE